MADEGTPIRAAMTEMRDKIKDLENNIKTLENRLEWVSSPEPPKKMDLDKSENLVTSIVDLTEAMEGKHSTLLGELVGCINKLEMMSKKIENLLKRLDV